MAAPTPPPTPTTTIVQPTPTPTVVPVPARKSRRTCTYTLEERAVLGVYKREYKASTNHHERGNLLRNRLLPAIFNHWYQKDQVMPSEDVALKRRKDICDWIRNNWRQKRKFEGKSSRKKVTRIQLVWRDRKKEVEEEMQRIYEEEGGSGDMDGRTTLRLRPTAAKAIYDRLDDNEKAEVGRAIEQSAAEACPPEVQQKRAAKYAAANVRQWADDQWKDMGMITVTLYAYKNPDQQLTVGVNDQTTYIQGQKGSFYATHSDLLKNVLLKFLDHVKKPVNEPAAATRPANRPASSSTPAINNPKSSLHSLNPPEPAGQQVKKGQIELEMEAGFPIMPAVEDTPELRKEDMVELVRMYLTSHYVIASGGRKKKVPFKLLHQQQLQFINRKYHPPQMQLKDPHNMTKDGLVALCQHIHQRQADHGVTNAFRFQRYSEGDTMVMSKYCEPARKPKKSRTAGHADSPTKTKKGKQPAAGRPDTAGSNTSRTLSSPSDSPSIPQSEPDEQPDAPQPPNRPRPHANPTPLQRLPPPQEYLHPGTSAQGAAHRSIEPSQQSQSSLRRSPRTKDK